MYDMHDTALLEGDRVKFFPKTNQFRCPECGNTSKFGVVPSEVICTQKGKHANHGDKRMVQVSRLGTVSGPATGSLVDVHLDGDPFPVAVEPSFIQKVRKDERGDTAMSATPATKSRPGSVKALRAQAKKANIEGWEQMSIADLEAAVGVAPTKAAKAPKAPKPEADVAEEKSGKAKTSKAPKAPAKKATKPAAAKTAKAPATKTAAKPKTAKVTTPKTVKTAKSNGGPNPFRAGSQRALIAAELLKGGKLVDMRNRLRKHVTLVLRDGSKMTGDAFDKELSHRIAMTAYDLINNYGATRDKTGRGDEAHWQIIPASK
jgi:hypothetical protein